MRNLKTVYAYRYNEKENCWKETEIKNVFVTGTNEAYSLSDTLNKKAHITLRVMSDEKVDVAPQDVISFSKSQGEKPVEPCAVVVSVTKNEKGGKAIRHTKILCS